jgi:hypothetical protein
MPFFDGTILPVRFQDKDREKPEEHSIAMVEGFCRGFGFEITRPSGFGCGVRPVWKSS